MASHSDLANLIWQLSDLMRGHYAPPEYGRVVLPMVALRRFDCVLENTKHLVVAEYKRRRGTRHDNASLDCVMNRVAGQCFHNHSEWDFQKLKREPLHIRSNLLRYINGFSTNVQRIFEFYEFGTEIERMHAANILHLLVIAFGGVDLRPETVSSERMGLVFGNLIRRFDELADKAAGDHFTPRDVKKLMVDLLFIGDDNLLTKHDRAARMLDPACGTGGMLAEAQSYIRRNNISTKLCVYGQDYNRRAFATAASDMLIKQVDLKVDGDNVRFGDSFTDDKFKGQTFDFFITRPPISTGWKMQKKTLLQRHENAPEDSPWSAGLPRVSDGSLLFLQHMIDKFEDVDPEERKYGSRAVIVFSGSPLFIGSAGSGESNIRKWIIERDLLEAIIALPEQLYRNTGIGTYIWTVTNNKSADRRGKIQLIDARDIWTPMRRSQGDKRRKLGEGGAHEGDDHLPDEPDQIAEIVRLYGAFETNERSKIFNTNDFGYTRVTIEEPLRLRYQMTVEDQACFFDAAPYLLYDILAIDQALGSEPQYDWNVVWARIEKLLEQRKSRWRASEVKLFRSVFTVKDAAAEPVKEGEGFEADPDLRDFENIPKKEDVDDYFAREILPNLPGVWMDRGKDRVGYEINFNRYFYRHNPLRKLVEIDADLKKAENELLQLMHKVPV